jgi:hypothetical protein
VVKLLSDDGGFRHIGYSKRVNTVGVYSLEMTDEPGLSDYFPLDAQIEVWRALPDFGIGWYKEFEGLHRTPVTQKPLQDPKYRRSHGQSYLDLIDRRYILYKAGSAGAEKSGPGENVIKAFVRENAGSLATLANGRLVDGQTTGLSVQANGGLGAQWEGSRAYKKLLATIQEIGIATGVEFEVVGTGAATFEFRTYYPRIGTDRSTIGLDRTTGFNASGNTPVIFDEDLKLITDVSYSKNRTGEKTVAIALGQGEGVDRATSVQIAADRVDDSPWNKIEETINSTQETTDAGLAAAAQGVLDENGIIRKYSFQARHSKDSKLVYGRDYFVGDLVTAIVEGEEVHMRIPGVRCEYRDQHEQLVMEFEEW